MPRPPIPFATQLQIGFLYERHGSIDKVIAALSVDVSRGSVAKYINGDKNRWRPVFRPVDWSDLPASGLPETALGMLLRIWNETWGDSRLPTVLEAQWWWRIACALPEEHPSAIRQHAQQFVWREALRKLGDLTVPADDADLWAWVAARVNVLAVAPADLPAWVKIQGERQRAYQERLAQGVVQLPHECVFSVDNTVYYTPACLYDLEPGTWVAWLEKGSLGYKGADIWVDAPGVPHQMPGGELKGGA